MTPWNILAFAESLLNFMDGYTIWLAPISGILICGYWIMHEEMLSVPEMYDVQGICGYDKWGTNWRAAVAFLVEFAPLLPGFAASVNSKVSVSQGAVNFSYLGYFWGFFVGGGLHVLLSKLFPAKETMLRKQIAATDEEV